jgi:hypothetical protein
MAQATTNISSAEAEILRVFCNYGIRRNEMLFFNRSGKDHSAQFTAAMKGMVSRGLLVQESRHRDAYSLSDTGYEATRTLGKVKGRKA